MWNRVGQRNCLKTALLLKAAFAGVLLAAVASSTTLAQDGRQHQSSTVVPQTDPTPLPPPRPLSPQDEARRQSAVRLLETVRDRRPQEDWIPSARMVSRQAEDLPYLLPEGTRVVDRTGSLRQAGDWWAFVPASDDPPLPPLRLLPNAMLEAAVRTLLYSNQDLVFALSGEITLFKNENYLLLRLAVRHRTPPAEPQAPVAREDAPPNGADAASANQAPAESDEANNQAKPMDPDAVIKLLQEQQPSREVIPAPERVPAAEAETALQPSAGAAPLPDNVPVIRRPGRLTRDGQWWSFNFEAGENGTTDVPLRLLPCQALERMVEAQESAPPDPIFVVSGEITAYDGVNYLLVRSATRRLEMGNLKK
ncbi:MAG: hypothetical protein J5J06_19210 [Phycisphaerae bacterium]|nr:hypothetical protein [Phycisphaerae bacterium]